MRTPSRANDDTTKLLARKRCGTGRALRRVVVPEAARGAEKPCVKAAAGSVAASGD
jgi:hypothetical protein